MPLRTWLAAYNLPTGEWTSGGTRDEYPVEHYDVFEMSALDRDHAIRLARQMRSKALSITARQIALLDDLKARAAAAPDTYNFSVAAGQRGTAKQLAGKGLLLLRERDASVVRLTGVAYIPSVARKRPRAKATAG